MEPCFQRGLSGKWKLAEGIPGEIINFLRKAKAEACYQIKFLDTEQYHVVFEVEKGNVVMETFDISDEISRKHKLEIKALNGHVTILDQLPITTIYDRIKQHYLANNTRNNTSSISSFPSNPDKDQLKKLIDQILCGSLEYDYHCMDKYSVEMHQYAEALAKKIGYEPFTELDK
jgi:hypothetical protein